MGDESAGFDPGAYLTERRDGDAWSVAIDQVAFARDHSLPQREHEVITLRVGDDGLLTTTGIYRGPELIALVTYAEDADSDSPASMLANYVHDQVDDATLDDWRQVWNAAVELTEKHLDTGILQRARRMTVFASGYNMCLRSEHLRQLADSAPAAGGLLCAAFYDRDSRTAPGHLPPRMEEMLLLPLPAMLAGLLRSRSLMMWNTMADRSAPVLEWLKHTQFTPDYGMSGYPWFDRDHARAMITSLVEHGNVDRLRQIRDPHEWQLLAQAAWIDRETFGGPETKSFPRIMRDTRAALNAVRRYHPPEHRAAYAEDEVALVAAVLQEVHDYTSRVGWYGDAGDELGTTLSFARVCEQASAWHRRQREATYSPPEGRPLDFTSSPLDGLPVGEMRLVQLKDSHALAQEGHVMDHCVGSYGDRCWVGDSVVFSVHDRRDQRVATIELNRYGHVVQSFGPRNFPLGKHFTRDVQRAITAANPPLYVGAGEAAVERGLA